MNHPKFIDYTKRRIGKLMIIRRAESRKYSCGAIHTLWIALCDCGKETQITSANIKRALRLKRKSSCGCARKNRVLSGYEDGRAAKTQIINSYRCGAKARKIAWVLKEEDFLSISQSLCHYCGAEPCNFYKTASGGFYYNGLDRKDNLQGYVTGNVLPCCKTCNFAKRDMKYSDFISWLVRAGKHQMEKGNV